MVGAGLGDGVGSVVVGAGLGDGVGSVVVGTGLGDGVGVAGAQLVDAKRLEVCSIHPPFWEY